MTRTIRITSSGRDDLTLTEEQATELLALLEFVLTHRPLDPHDHVCVFGCLISVTRFTQP